jgi:uncharacterized membrane protein YqjE
LALFQALFSALSRSLGKILNSIFGWAVVALFGQTTPTQKTLLSGLVGLAAAWPVLLVGVAFPKIAGLLLAFVPPSAQGPSRLMRIIWIAVAFAVPFTLGWVMAAKAPPDAPRESLIKRALRGFPITVALAVAFVITFVSVPFLRIAAALKRHKDEHVPLTTTADAYRDVADRIDAVLAAQKIDARRTAAPWWQTAPTKVLLKLGGRAFRGFIPAELAYWKGQCIQIALYPSDLLLRGVPSKTGFAHGVITEDLTRSDALQTFDPAAQEIEKQIRRVWRVYGENPEAHRRSAALLGRLDDITNQLAKVDVPYEEWSILYRKCGQLSRALDGQQQLLAKGKDMEKDKQALAPAGADALSANLSTPRLLGEAAREAVALVKSEIELAKAELKQDLKSELAGVKGLSVAAILALFMVNVLLVAGVFGLATLMPGWLAALIVAGLVGLAGGIAGAVGWKHVRMPFSRTRKSLEEDARMIKERVA